MNSSDRHSAGSQLAGIAFSAALFLLGCAVLSPASDPVSPAVQRLTRDGGFKQHLHFSPDGQKLLFTRIHKGKMGLWLVNREGGDLHPLVHPDPNTPHFDGHFSPDGKHVLYVHDILQGTDGKLQINRCDADGKNVQVIVPNKAFEETPRWSPDGKGFLWVTTRDGNQEIYTASADGKNLKRLTNDLAFDNTPAWSPDGKHIAFASSRSGNFEIHTMRADGTQTRKLTSHPAVDYWPAWSPDGKYIAFTSHREGNYDIFLMREDGSNLRNLTRHPAQDTFAAWSPDGKRLAFISTRHGGHDIYLMEVPRE